MFLPLRSDRRLAHTPWVNYALIAINVIIFICTKDQIRSEAVTKYELSPLNPQVYQFITYQFLHGSWLHLLGNMVFLYVFGNSVEDRFGKIGYLGFYLAGGVIAGLGHALVESVPVLGASGSIAAVTGAYLALFPLSNITVWLYFSTFEVSGFMLILFQIGENIYMQVTGGTDVAYLAHLSGYTYGFLIGMMTLWTRLLPREPYDLLTMIEQYRRRARFRAMTKQGFQPWESTGNREPVTLKAGKAPPEMQKELMDRRAEILAEFNNHNLGPAADLYEQLLDIDAAQVFPSQPQKDIANQLMASGKHDSAARAYELFLNSYRKDPDREQIELILGLLYARYLDRRQRARELLTAAIPRLHDPQQKTLAEEALAQIASGPV